MRRILVDRVRRRRRLRHGGDQRPVSLDAITELPAEARSEQVFAVDEALERFAAEAPEHAELVKPRCFVGLRLCEAAQVLGISESTAKRWWSFARAWMLRGIGR